MQNKYMQQRNEVLTGYTDYGVNPTDVLIPIIALKKSAN